MRGPVLIVEDDKSIRESLVDLLQDEGYKTLEAANGQEALDTLRVVRPSLMLLDLMMPVMNGWQLLDAMKKDPALSDLPVVILSASASQETPKGVLRLIKPIPLDVLLREIGKRAA